MDTAEILREKAYQIHKLWADISMIVDSGSLAARAYNEYDLGKLNQALAKGDF